MKDKEEMLKTLGFSNEYLEKLSEFENKAEEIPQDVIKSDDIVFKTEDSNTLIISEAISNSSSFIAIEHISS